MNQRPIEVWHGGPPTDHRAASGKPPVKTEPELGDQWRPMPLPDLSGLNNVDVGVHERVCGGRHEAQAFAMVYDGSVLESEVYGLVVAADEVPRQDPMDNSRPFQIRELTIEAARERAWSAATARARMAKDERSPLDMIAIARDLGVQARRLERAWQQEQDRIAAQARQDAEDMALAERVRRGFLLLEQQEKEKKNAK